MFISIRGEPVKIRSGACRFWALDSPDITAGSTAPVGNWRNILTLTISDNIWQSWWSWCVKHLHRNPHYPSHQPHISLHFPNFPNSPPSHLTSPSSLRGLASGTSWAWMLHPAPPPYLAILTGWWLTYPSEKYEFVSWDDDIPNIWKKLEKKCSKPPTS